MRDLTCNDCHENTHLHCPRLKQRKLLQDKMRLAFLTLPFSKKRKGKSPSLSEEKPE